MPYIDLAGLSRYASRQKDRLERDYALFRDMQWTLSEKAGAVSLWPAGGTPLEPVVDFLFTEVPPASGDKGPENPSTITGIDSLYVRICGKNLLPVDFTNTTVGNGETYQKNNIVATNNNGVYSLSVASGAQSVSYLTNLYIFKKDNNDAVLQPGTYTLSGYTRVTGMPSGTQIQLQLYPFDGSSTVTYYCYNGPVTFTIDRPYNINVYIRSPEGSTFPAGFTCSPQLEIGSEATEFEPGTLNNYTISLGSTYYGGTLDAASGVMTVTHGVLILDGTELWSTPTQVAEGIYRHGFTHQNGTLYSLGSGGGSSCTHFNYIYSANAPQISYYLGSYSAQRLMYVNMKTSYATADAQKAWLASEYSAGHPVAITGLLYAPFTVQLDPVSISALAQADKYTPRLNTVYTDAQAVQVGYIKSPIRDEYELTQAIAAQGGNV